MTSSHEVNHEVKQSVPRWHRLCNWLACSVSLAFIAAISLWLADVKIVVQPIQGIYSLVGSFIPVFTTVRAGLIVPILGTALLIVVCLLVTSPFFLFRNTGRNRVEKGQL